MGIVAIPLSNFGMFSRKFVVTFGSSVRYGVANNLINALVIEESVEEILRCRFLVGPCGVKNFPHLFLAAWTTNESHFAPLATDFRRAHRCLQYHLLRLHLQTILDPNNHHFHVSYDQNSGRLHRQSYKGFVVLFIAGILHRFEKFTS